MLTIVHPYVKAFQKICRENQIITVPNFYQDECGNRYDASVAISEDGEMMDIQKMVHIAQAERF